MSDWVWDAMLLLFGIAELWVFFIEPSIEKREDSSARKRRDLIEERKAQLELDRKELAMLREELAKRREEAKE